MESIKTATRIHPLMAAAALSVITVSIAGTAAITGLLPTSKADVPVATVAPAVQADGMPLPANAMPVAYYAAPAPLPVAVKPAAPVRLAVYEEKPAPKPTPKPKPRPQPKEVHDHHVVQNDAPSYQAPAVQPAPKQPNYVGIGAGAVIGGLLGNQVGGGNGKKLATLAGIIGGGMIGNEIQNRTNNR